MRLAISTSDSKGHIGSTHKSTDSEVAAREVWTHRLYTYKYGHISSAHESMDIKVWTRRWHTDKYGLIDGSDASTET